MLASFWESDHIARVSGARTWNQTEQRISRSCFVPRISDTGLWTDHFHHTAV